MFDEQSLVFGHHWAIQVDYSGVHWHQDQVWSVAWVVLRSAESQ